MSRLLLGALCGIVGLLSPLQAVADCVDTDIAGTWQFIVMHKGDAPFGMMSCQVRIDSDGLLEIRPKARCLVRHQNTFFGGLPIISGSFSVRRTCEVRGGFGTFDVYDDTECNFKIDKARLTDDKLFMSGVGVAKGNNSRKCGEEVFDLMAIKR